MAKWKKALRVAEASKIDRRTFIKGSAVAAGALALGLPSWSRGMALSETGELIYGSLAEPPSIDPSIGYDLWTRWSADNTYDSLYRYTGNPAELVPNLATSHTVSDDGLTWQFTLRSDVTFHDGTPLTASDVVFSFDRLQALQGAPLVLFRGILEPGSVVALNDTLVEFRLTRRYAPFLGTLPWLYILNEELLRTNEQDGDWGREWLRSNDAGSGPFFIESYAGGERIVYRKYSDYWRGWHGPHLSGWVYQISQESSTLRLQLERGNIDFTDYLTVDDWMLAAANPSLKTSADETLGAVMLKFNLQRYPADNVHLRRALAYSFDYDGIIDGLLGGYGGRMDSALPAGFWGYKSFANDPVLDYSTNLEKARSALVAANLPPEDLNLVYNYVGADATQRDYGIILRSSAQRIGVNIEVEGLTAPVFLGRLANPAEAGHVNRISMGGDPDPDTHLFQQYHSSNWKASGGAWFSCNYLDNPRVDELLEAARTETDLNLRVPMYEEVQRALLDDCVSIFTNTRLWFTAMQPSVQGFDYIGAGFNSTFIYPMWNE